jgi:hypothetical protein
MKIGDKVQRSASRIRDRCRRAEIPTNALHPRPDGLVARLQKHDSALDMLWHAGAKKWVLYRVTVGGVTSCEDIMMRVLVLDKPPGEWVLDWLRKRDISKNGQFSVDEGVRRFMKILDQDDALVDEAREKEEDAMHEQYRRDLNIIAVGRKSMLVSGGMGSWHSDKPKDKAKVAISLQTGKRVDVSKMNLAVA